MSLSRSTAIFGLSMLAIPMCYIVNTTQTLYGENGLFVSGLACLVIICFLAYLIIGRKGTPTDPLFYVIMLGTFASAVDLIIGLENDGIVRGLMTQYLENGEPYLKTPYGVYICYFDGIAHYIMYALMLVAYERGQSYREVGLYWAGSIGHSMIVFIPGNVIGKYGLHASFLLNVPYMFIPFTSCARFLRERPSRTLTYPESKQQHTSIMSRPVDIFLLLTLLASASVAILRGFAVLGCRSVIFESYIPTYEPYLLDPVAYPKMQVLVYLFYFLPFYIMAIYGLLFPGCSWMPDWTLIAAGAAANAQVSHIGGSLHHRTPYNLRVPANPDVRLVFWIINLGLLVLPQILAYRCATRSNFFTPARKTPKSD